MLFYRLYNCVYYYKLAQFHLYLYRVLAEMLDLFLSYFFFGGWPPILYYKRVKSGLPFVPIIDLITIFL